jgi:putative transposase
MSADKYFIREQNDPHYVTFTVVDWVDVFTRHRYKEIIVENLNYCIENKGLEVYAWCLMSNHLHAIFCAKEGFELSGIIRDYKKYTSKKIVQTIQTEPESRREWLLHRFKQAGKSDKRITEYKFWQETNHAISFNPHIHGMFDQKLNYIHDNPVRAGIVDYPHEYLYSSARDYAGKKGLVNVTLVL